jgi:hypothetical protein
MPNDIAENSTTPSSVHTRDEDDLKTLKLQDRDLDQFAAYFELAFQGNRQSITVLVALLQRLREVETLHRKKQSAIWVEDVVGRLIHRLYTRCDPGFEAASRFATESSDLAEQIFSDALSVSNKS